MEDNTARLRKTFQHRDDNSSSDSLPEALDEEEQETLIQNLTSRNASANQIYKTLFTALCLACTLPYLIAFLLPSSTNPRAQTQTRLVSILSITSLCASAYILYYLPNPASSGTGFLWLDKLITSARLSLSRHPKSTVNPPASARTRTSNNNAQGIENRLPQLGDRVDKSPFEIYLPTLNLVLVFLLAMVGILVSQRSEAGTGLLAYALLPGGVYGVVVVVRVLMGSVDVGELEGLRYGYKGA